MTSATDPLERELRRDVCPTCGDGRLELLVAPGRFYCPTCELAGEGPNADAGAGAQLALEVGR